MYFKDVKKLWKNWNVKQKDQKEGFLYHFSVPKLITKTEVYSIPVFSRVDGMHLLMWEMSKYTIIKLDSKWTAVLAEVHDYYWCFKKTDKTKNI